MGKSAAKILLSMVFRTVAQELPRCYFFSKRQRGDSRDAVRDGVTFFQRNSQSFLSGRPGFAGGPQ